MSALTFLNILSGTAFTEPKIGLTEFRARTTLTFINISTLAFLSNSAGRGISLASIAVVYTRQGRGSPCNPVQTCGTYHSTAEKRAAPRNIRRPTPITGADGQFTAPKKSKDQKRQKPADGRRLPGEVYTERRRSRHRLLYLLANRPEKNACKRNIFISCREKQGAITGG